MCSAPPKNDVGVGSTKQLHSLCLSPPSHLPCKTVELTATQQLVKNSGVKCSKRDLASFLDDKGITFIDRGAGGKNSAGRRKKESRAADRAGRGTASHR